MWSGGKKEKMIPNVKIEKAMRFLSTGLSGGIAFVVVYVLFDWASYLHPMYGLNITPWNPSPALGMVLWLRWGRRIALPWFAAILIGEIVVRGVPASLPWTLGLSLVLTAGYGIMAESLRRSIAGGLLHDRRRLLTWLLIVVLGTLVTSTVYISLLYAAGLIPVGDWGVALARFWIGDCVGIVVTMPFFWLALNDPAGLGKQFMRLETAGYIALAAVMLWVAFGLGGEGEFQYFYLLFPSIVWAAARQGVPGAAVAAFVLQAGIIVAVQWQNLVAVTVFELQLLGAVLAFVGLFIGVIVDEKQRVSNELKQSLRLAAAGEMAAALAHELNQPLTALSAYGSACRKLLSRGGDDERLRDTIERMVAESHRTADVVRRLRDFFRTGATRLETISLQTLITAVVAQFEDKIRAHNIALEVALMPECQLLVDRLQIEVVIRNLLSNAFDAVVERPEGQRHITVSAEMSGRKRVRLLFRDSGAGLDSSQTMQVFEAFHSSKSSGLGLGLAVSRAIVLAHGGDLEAQAGEGGIFVLTLPVGGEIEDAS
jgi:signal transduction histidine kinase